MFDKILKGIRSDPKVYVVAFLISIFILSNKISHIVLTMNL